MTLSATAPTLITFTNATNVTRVVFTSSGGTGGAYSSFGTQFAMDDLSYFLGIPRAITATASPTAGGSVTCTPNPVADGANATCTASANAGYALTGFTGCTRMGTTNDCELSNVTAPATVSAAFTAVPAVLTSGTLPDATEGQPYSQALQATGGTAPYTWAVVSGSLPAGLTLDPATGVISGTVSKVAQATKATGPFSFGVQLMDNSSPQLQSAVQPLSLQVVAAAPATVTPVPTLGAWAMALLGLITAGLGLRRRVNAQA